MVALDLSHLNELCGAGAVSRGRIYYEAGRVSGLSRGPGGDTITATVAGSRGQSHQATVFLGHAGQVTGGVCTCPVGSDCKHVVATALEAAGADRQFSVANLAPAARWQRQLDSLLGPVGSAYGGSDDGGGEGADAVGPAPAAAGLQLRVDGLARTPAKRATHPGSPLMLSARPVVLGPAGSPTHDWRLGWDSLRHGHVSRPWDREIDDWFRELAALHTQGQWGAPAVWAALADFRGRWLWPHLARGSQLGVRLMGQAAGDEVRLAGGAEVFLDFQRQQGDVSFAPALAIDGEQARPELGGMIGAHGVFPVAPPAAGRAGWQIVLAPLGHPVSRGAESLVNPRGAAAWVNPSRINIPERDFPRFATTYLPKLRRRLPVRSGDGSFTVPEPPAPTLVATATFTSPTTAQLTLRWEYELTAEQTLQYPLAPLDDDGLRDFAAEREVWDRVAAAVSDAGLDALPVHGDLAFTNFDALRLVDEILPLLGQVPGVEVVVVGQPGFTELTEQPVIELGASDSDDADWFNLAVTIRVAGREVPLPNVMEALARGRTKLMLVDGSWLRLKHPSLEPLRALLAEAERVTDRRGKLRVSRHQAALWDELAELADVVEQSRRWREAVTGLLALADGQQPPSPPPIPAAVQATLRPYQVAGFHWLAFCWEHGLGGILADDMGLGKTLQALTLVQHAKARQPGGAPFLIVAPASVTGNWVSEAARFTPGLRVIVIPKTVADPSRLAELVAGADVVVASYAIFRLAEFAFRGMEWAGLILDEAQFIKNRATKSNQLARRLRAPFKLAITGTPMENNVAELWALLAVVSPGLFPSFERFREDYLRPVEAMHKPERSADVARHGAERLELLRRRVRPLLLRRTKEQVAPELPSRTEQVVDVVLAPAHQRVYDVHLARERQRVLGLLDDYEANKVAVFRALTTLRRLALDASLIDAEAYGGIPSSKLDVLMEQLESVIAEGHRALVFSQFTGYLAIVRERLRARGVEFAYLDGSTRNRAAVIEGFRGGAAPVFLISLKAGGFGLNLTEADYVFLLDPWWNPAVEAQAIDRTHRIGQTKPVMVQRLVAAGTIEEKVMALKSRKSKLVGAVLRDDLRAGDGVESSSLGAGITASDIRQLLS